MAELFDQLEFVEDPLFETIIDDLLQQNYSVIDNFFSEDKVTLLRDALLDKYRENDF
jgi:SM-20-related protein